MGCRFRSLVSGSAMFLVLVLTASLATAQTVMQFDLPEQALADSLRAVARQTNTNVLFDRRLVRGRTAPALRAQATLDAALTQLLQGTGIRHRFVDDKTVTLEDRSKPVVQSPGQAAPSDAPAGKVGASTDASSAISPRVSPAASDGDSAGGAAVNGSDAPGTRGTFYRDRDAVAHLEEVVVTGSRLRQALAAGPVPVNIYTREQIERSGRRTVGDFLNTLPEVSLSTTEATGGGTGLAQTTVQLRGLPVGTTLTLLNGRRLAASAATNGVIFDLSSIPLAAIERIEIVPQGSSAIYGSDALAGVVNFILRSRFEGAEADVGHATADGMSESTASVAFGHSLARASWSLIGSYLKRSELRNHERALTADNDYRRFGGLDRRSTLCNPGNVTTTNGAPLPGLSSSSAAIPAAVAGRPTIQDFQPTAGTQNRCSNTAEWSAYPASELYGVLASGNYVLSDRLQLFAELVFSKRQTFSASNNTLIRTIVPASNAFNPFGVPVSVDYEFADADSRRGNEVTVDFLRPLVGATGRLVGAWDWEIATHSSTERNRLNNPAFQFNEAELSTRLASSDPQVALNLFATAPPPVAVMDSLLIDPEASYRARASVASAFVRGPAFALPAGRVEAVLGAEYAESEFFRDESAVLRRPREDFERANYSFFGEARVPIARIGGSGHPLAVSAAVRHEHYEGFGTKLVPQFGAEWRPISPLLMRAAYSESFRAPRLSALFGTPTSSIGINIRDPRRNEQYAVSGISGGRPDLEPETGRSTSFGMVWRDQRLTAEATYWTVVQKDRVNAPSAQVLMDNEPFFPERVIRGPDVGGLPGRVTLLDRTFLNFGELSTRGIDARSSIRFDTSIGEWAPRVAVTRVLAFDAAITPTTPTIDRLSKANTDAFAPSWKGTAGIDWTYRTFSASVSAHYTGRYRDFDDQRDLGDFVIYDFSAGYELGNLLRDNRYLSDLTVSVGVVNALDRLPDFSNTFLGYDATQYDLRGRFIHADVRMKW